MLLKETAEILRKDDGVGFRYLFHQKTAHAIRFLMEEHRIVAPIFAYEQEYSREELAMAFVAIRIGTMYKAYGHAAYDFKDKGLTVMANVDVNSSRMTAKFITCERRCWYMTLNHGESIRMPLNPKTFFGDMVWEFLNRRTPKLHYEIRYFKGEVEGPLPRHAYPLLAKRCHGCGDHMAFTTKRDECKECRIDKPHFVIRADKKTLETLGFVF